MNNTRLSRDVDDIRYSIDNVLDNLVNEIEELESINDKQQNKIEELEEIIDDLKSKLNG